MPEETGPNAQEPNSLEEIFTALETPLLRYALKLTQSSQASEDIVQEAFMKLHVQFEKVRLPRPWLYRTVHNLAMNHHRSTAKVVPVDFDEDGESQVPVNVEPLPDEHIQRMEAIGRARLCLESLDERKRELIRLKFDEDLSYKEMSGRTGLTVSNVGYLLHNALKELAVGMEITGETP